MRLPRYIGRFNPIMRNHRAIAWRAICPTCGRCICFRRLVEDELGQDHGVDPREHFKSVAEPGEPHDCREFSRNEKLPEHGIINWGARPMEAEEARDLLRRMVRDGREIGFNAHDDKGRTIRISVMTELRLVLGV